MEDVVVETDSVNNNECAQEDAEGMDTTEAEVYLTHDAVTHDAGYS